MHNYISFSKRFIFSHHSPPPYVFLLVFSAWYLHTFFLIQTRWHFHRRKQYYEEDLFFNQKCLNDKFFFLQTQDDVNWRNWSNCLWIVMFLSAVWTLILTAPIHCRGSTGVQVTLDLLDFSKSVQMKKQTHLHLVAWGLITESKFKFLIVFLQ